MNNRSYYRLADDSGCDLAVTDRPLVVNCSGVCVLSEPFTSHNRTGRRDYYLMYLVQGELEMVIGGETHTVQAGHTVLYPPGYAYRYTKRGHNRLVYYWAHFTGYGAQLLLDGCGLDTQTIYHAGVCADVAESFAALFQNFIYRDGCFDTATAAQLTTICVLLRRKIDGVSAGLPVNSTERIRESMDFMHRHYCAPVTLAELAEIEHLSVSRYSAVFRQCLGVSPRTFLIDLRLNMATELMLGTDLSLKQIAKKVGYEDQLYFSRLFKRRKGVSPRQFLASAASTHKP